MKEFVFLTLTGLLAAGLGLGLLTDPAGDTLLPGLLIGFGLWVTLLGVVAFPPDP